MSVVQPSVESRAALAEATLGMNDFQRRVEVGQRYGAALGRAGLTETYIDYNIGDALPGTTKDALVRHGAPYDAYGGRAAGVAFNLVSSLPVTIMGAKPMGPELAYLDRISDMTGIQQPTFTDIGTAVPDSAFVYPFIGTAELNKKYPGRTFAPAMPYNHKGNMRRSTVEVAGSESVVPGAELYAADHDEFDPYAASVYDALRRQNPASGRTWLKLAETASGLSTVRFTEEQLAAVGFTGVRHELLTMFGRSPRGELQVADVVVEHHVDFGEHEGQPADYNLRGAKTADGQFVPQTVGRQVSNSGGEYIGAVMVDCDDPEALGTIGLTADTFVRAASTVSSLARRMGEDYPFGPMSVDFFSQQLDPDSPVQMRDFNMREGGTTFGGFIGSLRKQLWPGASGVLDAEYKIDAKRVMSEQELSTMLEKMYGADVVPYASSFLMYPQVAEDGSATYTMKVVAPFNGIVRADDDIIKEMRRRAAQFNAIVDTPVATFRSSL